MQASGPVDQSTLIVGRQLLPVGVELVDSEGDDPLGVDSDELKVQPTEGLDRAADLQAADPLLQRRFQIAEVMNSSAAQ